MPPTDMVAVRVSLYALVCYHWGAGWNPGSISPPGLCLDPAVLPVTSDRHKWNSSTGCWLLGGECVGKMINRGGGIWGCLNNINDLPGTMVGSVGLGDEWVP